MFINEFNGRYWEKKVMNEGITIVIENPCFDDASGTTAEVCWEDSEGIEHCVTIEIPKVAQSNLEYRVYLNEDTCEKYLMNTDDLVVERVLSIIVPMLEQERNERIEADAALSGAIDDLRDDLEEEISARTEADDALSGAIDDLRDDLEQEIEERISADTELWEALSAETEARISADTILEEMIEAETERAISAETALDEKIDAETERATEREDEIEQELFEEIERAMATEAEISGLTVDTSHDYILSASTEDEEYNLVLESKDGIDEHFIKIKFDGNFGEI
jgi:Skp family chaperone for outer membrane proteins